MKVNKEGNQCLLSVIFWWKIGVTLEIPNFILLKCDYKTFHFNFSMLL